MNDRLKKCNEGLRQANNDLEDPKKEINNELLSQNAELKIDVEKWRKRMIKRDEKSMRRYGKITIILKPELKV